MDYRGKRFLIDKIDNRLGSLDKEIKFDKILICVGVLISAVSILVLILSSDSHPILSIITILATMFGLILTYTMIREYISDRKRLRCK